MDMFCNQCEQAKGGKGCDVVGVCGKPPEVAALQDLLVHALQGVSIYADKARACGARSDVVDRFVMEGLFTTVTNVNFDPERMARILRRAAAVRDEARGMYEAAHRAKIGSDPEDVAFASWTPAEDVVGLAAQGGAVGLSTLAADADVRSAKEILLYGLKGMAAYADHALIMGTVDESIVAFTHKALAALADPGIGLMDVVGLCLECGKENLATMELLSNAHVARFGKPTPTKVSLGRRKGKAILVSGHDLPDLEALLRQTEGKGVSIYTHGEMLPAHGYPGLKKYAHLAGNYGGAWQDQQKEFAAFPGAVLMTTNCIQKPKESYAANLFTCGLVAWPGVRHIEGRDFAPVIERALELPGFPDDVPGKEILVGFGHDAILSVAGTVVDAVKSGALKHFFLVGGCDGAKPGRNYYTEFAEKVPDDCVILTLACGKYRFNTHDFGDIGGIPRLLDVGQCNDAYSAVRVAVALSEAFGCGVNELPLSFVLSWYEQKAVVILLTLFHLGIRNIRIGPSLPAFITPNVLSFLVEKFNVMPITTAEEDLKAILSRVA